MVNKVTLIGRLGKDPDIRNTASGVVANFAIACTEKWNGEEKTEWVNIVAFSKLAEIVSKWVRKGSLIYVEGKLQTNSWDDKSGQKRYKTEVICQQMKMLGGKQKDEFDQREEEHVQMMMNETPTQAHDDDLPF